MPHNHAPYSHTPRPRPWAAPALAFLFGVLVVACSDVPPPPAETPPAAAQYAAPLANDTAISFADPSVDEDARADDEETSTESVASAETDDRDDDAELAGGEGAPSDDAEGAVESYVDVDGDTVRSPVASADGTIPDGASAQCRDGSYSFSRHRQGTCSHHGGVDTWL